MEGCRKSETVKDKCPSSTDHEEITSSISGSKNEVCPSSGELDMILEETSSHTESDKDYHPSSSSSSSSSSEDEESDPSPQRSNLSTHSSPEPDHCHSSSSEYVDLETENQETREQLVGKRKLGNKKKLRVTIRTSRKKEGRRAWDKAHYCLYCKKSNLKMARHLQRMHSDETDVAHSFSFPLGSKTRKTLLESIRNKGDWQHNLKVSEEGTGELVTWKRPSKKAPVSDYLPCQHCYAMFKRTELWRHEKTCRVRKEVMPNDRRQRVQKASSMLLTIMKTTEGIRKAIHSMLQDNVTSHIRADEMYLWNCIIC